MIQDYEKKVYESLLGKVIGVYVGRPFEGWDKKSIEQRLGTIRGYVHDRLNVPLVVSDDDISGTCTFIRALEDSGMYAETSEEFFGETWLNFILERQCILWWGGKGISTEHTAFLNLKNGIPSPESGATSRNSQIVAEQIGAQIFIDAFGMVAPGNPTLAIALAKKAACVSHDGEAVYAAQVVAALVSLGFIERDINRLLDAAIKFIPQDSLIAQIHRDVRAWSATDGDWNRTYDRIVAKYGYHLYGGGCHVVPNHAVMVMAWAYSDNNFHRAMSIVNTAGWDTDCNAANVGSVMGLVAGLDGIVADYDYRTPFADRVQIPTADGTDSASDVLRIAEKIAAMGRRIMREEPVTQPKVDAWHHFEMDGALHGYQADDFSFEMRGNATVTNRAFQTTSGERHALEIAFNTGASSFARVLTPTMIFNPGGSAYANVSTSHLYNGMTVRVKGAVQSLTKPASLRLVALTTTDFGSRAAVSLASDWTLLSPDKPFEASWEIQGCESATLVSFGLEFASESVSKGIVTIDSVSYNGKASVFHEVAIPHQGADNYTGWISNLDSVYGPLPNFSEPAERICKNQGLGLLVTGNRYWMDVSVQCKFSALLADSAGLVLRYQGARRFYSVVLVGQKIQIRLNYHGMKVLAETTCETTPAKLILLKAEVKGSRITVTINGVERLSAQDDTLTSGGAGYCMESGVCAFRETRIIAKTQSGR